MKYSLTEKKMILITFLILQGNKNNIPNIFLCVLQFKKYLLNVKKYINIFSISDFYIALFLLIVIYLDVTFLFFMQ